MKRLVVFTDDEWFDFRVEVGRRLAIRASQSFQLIDRESGKEIVSRIEDFCVGMMARIIDDLTGDQ